MLVPTGGVPPSPLPRFATVVCSACKARVDMTAPLHAAGWHVVHICRHQQIEAEALAAGEPAWAWRAQHVVNGSE